MKSVTCPICGFFDDGFACYGIEPYWDEEKEEYICPNCGEILNDERY